MPIRVKLDEDLSPMVAGAVAAAGHIALTVRDQGWGGLPDEELWPRVVAEGVFLVTADKGFGDVRKHPPGRHPGVLVLRPDRESIVAYRSLLADVLAAHALDDLAGCVVVASSAGVRIRRPPAEG